MRIQYSLKTLSSPHTTVRFASASSIVSTAGSGSTSMRTAARAFSRSARSAWASRTTGSSGWLMKPAASAGWSSLMRATTLWAMSFAVTTVISSQGMPSPKWMAWMRPRAHVLRKVMPWIIPGKTTSST